ncbi:MAG: hypothetical protein IMZ52_06225 [Actinobacteria bacterium]|nr:hypothetical protein [Actinomycetota bacterium]MBE3114662.1 hypothetical protein [Actinomycetota bacterium]
MKLDISIALDDSTYLTPQAYLQIASLKDKIPEETTLHLTTTGNRKELTKYISKAINTKLYTKPPIENLKSRCSYLLRTIEIESDADYVLKTDLDVLFLKDFQEVLDLIKTDADIYIQSENRRIISDGKIETRLWKAVYKEMGFELPDLRIPYVENHEIGRPLLNSGAFIIKVDRLQDLQEKWINLTKKAEKFIQYNLHPNETALTAMILCDNWKWMGLHQWLHFNPISHYRKGSFPSQELIEDCKLPEEIFMLHYHKGNWLSHLARYNKNVQQIIDSVNHMIPSEWWNLPLEMYMEK